MRLTNPCAIMEGAQTVVVNSAHQYVVKRPVYIMDAGITADGVMLNVYIKTDTVTSNFDTTAIDYSTRVALPLTGGKVECFMAGNKTALFTGTNKSPVGAEILTANLRVSRIGGFSPRENVSPDYRRPTWLRFAATGLRRASPDSILFGPDGSLQEDGGGTAFLINTIQSVQLGASTPVSVQPLVVTDPAFHVSQ